MEDEFLIVQWCQGGSYAPCRGKYIFLVFELRMFIGESSWGDVFVWFVQKSTAIYGSRIVRCPCPVDEVQYVFVLYDIVGSCKSKEFDVIVTA